MSTPSLPPAPPPTAYPDARGARLSIAGLLSLIVHAAALAGMAAPPSGRVGLPTVFVQPGPVLVARLAPLPSALPELPPPPLIAAEVPTPAPAAPAVAPKAAPPTPATVARSLPQAPPRPSTEGVDITVRVVFDADRLPRDLADGLVTDYRYKPGRFPGPNKALALPYPETALRDRLSGSVHVLLHLDATGSVVRSTFDPEDSEFAPTVRAALSELRFIPAQLGGAPIPYWIAFEITFSIAGGAPK